MKSQDNPNIQKPIAKSKGESLHPSWLAKQKREITGMIKINSTITSKKIVFDD
jgi:hypothetical protein